MSQNKILLARLLSCYQSQKPLVLKYSGSQQGSAVKRTMWHVKGATSPFVDLIFQVSSLQSTNWSFLACLLLLSFVVCFQFPSELLF